MYLWVSSDTLWPVDLFIDTLHDGFSFHGWFFSVGPCWIPDIVLVGLCYLPLRDPILTTLVAGALHLIILAAGLCLCWRALRLAYRKLADTLTLASGIAITLWVAFHSDVLYPGLYQFLLPQTHVGNLIMHVYAIWLALLLIQLPRGRRRVFAAAGFSVVCMLAGLSNLMFFPHTVVPLSMAALALALAGALPVRRAALPVLLAWPSAVAGAAAYRIFFPAMGLGAQSSIGYAAWGKAARTFVVGAFAAFARFDLLHIAAALWFAACVLGGAILLRRLRRAKNVQPERRVLLVFFFFTSAAASLLGPATMIIGGSNGLTQFNNYMWTMHYMHPTFLLPLLAWPSLLALVPAFSLPRVIRRALRASAALACVIVPLMAFERLPAPAFPLSQYAPEFVRALDREARQYGIRYGLAGYWQARLITLLSRTGLRVYPVDGSINPFLIVSNREWFAKSLENRSRKPCFSFVVLNDPLWKLTRATAVEHAGEPSNQFDAAGVPVLVYAKEETGHVVPRCDALTLPNVDTTITMDRRLSGYRSAMSSPVGMIRATISERMRLPVRISNPGKEPWTSVGSFPVTLSYKWFKDGRMLPIEGERTSLLEALLPGATASLSARVVAPPEPGSYTLRFSLVQEGITWFMSAGDRTLDIPASVIATGAQLGR